MTPGDVLTAKVLALRPTHLRRVRPVVDAAVTQCQSWFEPPAGDVIDVSNRELFAETVGGRVNEADSRPSPEVSRDGRIWFRLLHGCGFWVVHVESRPF